MGFSPLGLAIALAILAPNLLLVAFPPREPLPPVHVPRALAWLERAGQALCLVVPVIVEPGWLNTWWTVPTVTAIAGYYVLWARYLRTRSPSALYGPAWFLPVPMAVLPVLAFLFAAALLGNPWLAASALVLAAGHVPVSALTRRALVQRDTED